MFSKDREAFCDLTRLFSETSSNVLNSLRPGAIADGAVLKQTLLWAWRVSPACCVSLSTLGGIRKGPEDGEWGTYGQSFVQDVLGQTG